jgi:phosphoribosylglycinamide formyltransferase-1
VQKTVKVNEDDTEETLSSRILQQEHKAFPEAIKLYAEGKIKIEGRRVRILK